MIDVELKGFGEQFLTASGSKLFPSCVFLVHTDQ